MDKDTFTARGHQIIADAMAKAKEAEQALHKNQAVSTHVEACLRDLWNLMMAPDETDAQRQELEHQAMTDGEAAAVEALAPPEPPTATFTPGEPAPIPAPLDSPKSLDTTLPPAASEPSTPHVPEAADPNVVARGEPAEVGETDPGV